MSVEASRHPFPGVVLERALPLEELAEMCTVAWAPDGRMLAAGGTGGVVRLWRSDGQMVGALPAHQRVVLSVAFSPAGRLLASGGADHSVRLWDVDTLTCTRQFTGHQGIVSSIAWSGDGTWFVSGSGDGTVRCGLPGGTELVLLVRHSGAVNSVAVSANGTATACASSDGTARLWHTMVRFNEAWPAHELTLIHPAAVHSVCFSPDGRFVVTGCRDAAIRIWDAGTGSMVRILEGHSTPVIALAFSPDGRFLVSKSDGGTVRLWRCDRWSQLGKFFEPTMSTLVSIGISRDNVLATFGDVQLTVLLWRLDPGVLLAGAERRSQYCNAKVVLVGDSGVGKSGLALALAGKPFVATESTHARNVWRLDERVVALAPDLEETREILLWDLAGQPAYRIVHQLHLHDTTVAILVFDARSETDPLAGVRHWDRALRQARRVLVSNPVPLRKLLVVARIDRGGVALGAARLTQLREELEIAEQDYFETSAKEGWGVAELQDAVDRLIDWEALPKVTSTRLFHDIQLFVVAAREKAQRLVTVPVLCDAFLAAQPGLQPADVRGQFATCVGRLESSGVVRSFAFGNYVLLQPELLDAYASAIVEAARDEPDGLGIIAEDPVRAGQFRIPADRLADPREEELLLIATIESLVRGEIALRESTDDGVVLLFPAQSTREPPPVVVELRPSYRVAFEGSARSVYATLAVRLTRSGVFQRDEIWRDGLTVRDSLGARCGVRLHGVTEVGGTLEVVVSAQTAPVIRKQLEQFVHAHVARRAVAATVRAEVVVVCDGCSVVFPPDHIQKRLAGNRSWIVCQVCDHRTELAGLAERRGMPEGVTVMPEDVTMMNRDADSQRERDAASVRLEGKAKARDFDVFLCHHGVDKREVKRIGEQLKARGYLPWLDEWELPPGQPWLRELEAQIESIRAAAVFIGADDTGPWQRLELDALLRQFIERGCPVIPVILPSVSIQRPRLPAFLRDFTWVDLRVEDPPPIDQLIWGITKVKPSSGPDASAPP